MAAGALVAAQGRGHSLVVLSHSNHTVYEVNPTDGAILHAFVAPDQPHEAAITSDGGTVFASVPAAGIVEILDGKTFREKGRIESDYFRTRDGKSASPHGMGVTSDNSRLYVGTENADISGVVVRRESGKGDQEDLGTMSVVARYQVGTDPFGGGVRVTS